MLALGYALPLFVVPLLAFLAVDLTIGATRHDPLPGSIVNAALAALSLGRR